MADTTGIRTPDLDQASTLVGSRLVGTDRNNRTRNFELYPGPLVNLGTAGTAKTISVAQGLRFRLVLNVEDCSLTISAPGDLSAITEIRLFLYRSGTGARGVTWPASVIWLSGSAPELGTVETAPDIIELITHDGGETWLGWRLGCCGAAAEPEPVVPVISIGSITI